MVPKSLSDLKKFYKPEKEIIPVLILVSNFIGKLVLNLKEALNIVFIHRKIYKGNLLENLKKITWTCLPISVLTVSASAIVYSIHTAPEFSKHGLTIYLGGLVGLSLIREGVPVMGTLAIVTQYCSGITAQIGSMKVTEQLDAMKMAKVSPIGYILVPMLLAGIIGFPIVSIVCAFIGLVINFIFSNLLINITYTLYTNSILSSIDIKDIMLGLVKSSVFGFFVTLVSYNCGITTVGGSKAVGQSTRLSVVINFALVIILDYVITTLWL